MTNYLRILNMTVDELADFILNFDYCEECQRGGAACGTNPNFCDKTIKEYLRSEASEE